MISYNIIKFHVNLSESLNIKIGGGGRVVWCTLQRFTEK